MDALLIVDMQVACIEDVLRHDIDSVILNINNLSSKFRNRHFPVIHIQHEEASGAFKRESQGWHFSSGIQIDVSDTVVAKTYCDAFIQTRLKATLESKQITRLVIVGCATDFCVDSTIKGAISNGYDVLIPEDAHTSSDRPHIKAEQLIKHFNWNWANLVTGSQSVSVMPASEVIGYILKPES